MLSTFDRCGCVGGEEAVAGAELIEELVPNISASKSWFDCTVPVGCPLAGVGGTTSSPSKSACIMMGEK
jgi:hypothetical protein